MTQFMHMVKSGAMVCINKGRIEPSGEKTMYELQKHIKTYTKANMIMK